MVWLIQIKFLAECIKSSSHLVAYTGAGLSTSAKLVDFRGPNGVWTRRDRGLNAPDCIQMEQATPTAAHRALVKLQDVGLLKYLTSQNIDGLHRRSGIKRELLSELHGNCFLESCAKCGAEYQRTFDVCRRKGTAFDPDKTADPLNPTGISHVTGRKCDACSGMLRSVSVLSPALLPAAVRLMCVLMLALLCGASCSDSIIHFSENLPQSALKTAIDHSLKADVALALGTSLRVAPACHLPQNCAQARGRLFIVNLQVTGKDKEALQLGGCLIAAKTDEVMLALMKQLGLDVPAESDQKQPTPTTPTPTTATISTAAAGSSALATTAIASYPKPAQGAAAIGAVKREVPSHFFVGNTISAVAGSSYRWALFVSGEAEHVTDCSHFIESVQLTFEDMNLPPVTLKPSDKGRGCLSFASFVLRLIVA